MANADSQSEATPATMSDPETKMLFLGAGDEMRCGVGHFTQLLQEAVEKLQPGCNRSLTLTRGEGSVADIWRAVGSVSTVVCNFPIVAWKRVMLRPLLALATARLRGKQVVLIQHEWSSLNWMRRLTYRPAILLANKIVMFSPLVRQELADDPLVGWAAGKSVLAPLPPNVEAPAGTTDSKLKQRLAPARANDNRLIVGHFGSIYPAKQPNALLDIAASLKSRGVNPLVVYIGSFIRGTDNVEADFFARVEALGLTDDVIVSGFVQSDHEVFGLFREIDVFCYPLTEGLTARRSSILACAQAGKPLIVTGPARTDEFEHHPRFKRLIEQGTIVVVPREAGIDAYAGRIIDASKRQAISEPFDFDGWWRDVAEAIVAQFKN
ncbi:MAG: hypothetical protein QM760_16455 [Nibricoccus sp.]